MSLFEESMLSCDPHIQSAIYFGRERFFCGVILEPKDAFVFDLSDMAKVAEFRDLIW